MSDDSADGLLMRLKNLFRSSLYSGIPDHPSHGGNTGETEWSPADTKRASEQAEPDSDERPDD